MANPITPLGKAFTAAADRKRITVSEVALATGLTRQAVHYWTRIGVPAKRAREVAAILKVRPSALRPDLY